MPSDRRHERTHVHTAGSKPGIGNPTNADAFYLIQKWIYLNLYPIRQYSCQCSPSSRLYISHKLSSEISTFFYSLHSISSSIFYRNIDYNVLTAIVFSLGFTGRKFSQLFIFTNGLYNFTIDDILHRSQFDLIIKMH